jgi:hypothetical protein
VVYLNRVIQPVCKDLRFIMRGVTFEVQAVQLPPDFFGAGWRPIDVLGELHAFITHLGDGAKNPVEIRVQLFLHRIKQDADGNMFPGLRPKQRQRRSPEGE